MTCPYPPPRSFKALICVFSEITTLPSPVRGNVGLSHSQPIPPVPHSPPPLAPWTDSRLSFLFFPARAQHLKRLIAAILERGPSTSVDRPFWSYRRCLPTSSSTSGPAASNFLHSDSFSSMFFYFPTPTPAPARRYKVTRAVWFAPRHLFLSRLLRSSDRTLFPSLFHVPKMVFPFPPSSCASAFIDDLLPPADFPAEESSPQNLLDLLLQLSDVFVSSRPRSIDLDFLAQKGFFVFLNDVPCPFRGPPPFLQRVQPFAAGGRPINPARKLWPDMKQGADLFSQFLVISSLPITQLTP